MGFTEQLVAHSSVTFNSSDYSNSSTEKKNCTRLWIEVLCWKKWFQINSGSTSVTWVDCRLVRLDLKPACPPALPLQSWGIPQIAGRHLGTSGCWTSSVGSFNVRGQQFYTKHTTSHLHLYCWSMINIIGDVYCTHNKTDFTNWLYKVKKQYFKVKRSNVLCAAWSCTDHQWPLNFPFYLKFEWLAFWHSVCLCVNGWCCVLTAILAVMVRWH